MTNFTKCNASPDDIYAYEQLVCAGMAKQDVQKIEEYRQMIQTGTLQAWWLIQEGQRIGWCALYPWHSKYVEKAWHLYGVWVRDDKRRQGLARQMWHFRMGMVPSGVPITVSIQPGKNSEALAKSFGFEKIGFNIPWNTYVYYKT